MDVRKLIDKLAEQEEATLGQSFLAPVVREGLVCVRIAGVICQYRLDDREFEGWGIFEPISLNKVKLLEKAPKKLIRQYQERLTPVDLIVADPEGSTRASVIAHPAGSQVKVDGIIPVHLVERVEQFRHIRARFDGFNFWFDRVHPRRNPAAAAYLRKSLNTDLEADSIHYPGLTPQEKKLYAHVLALERKQKEDSEQVRIRKALEHGGAVLESFYKKKNAYTIKYLIDGDRYTSVVRKKDLTVISAGICLDGEDQKFDLHSLVGVLKEAGDHDEFD